MTTDGSFTEIPRESYVSAEARVIGELKAINKPFIVLLNSAAPNSDTARAAAREIESAYDVTVMPVNCAELSAEDINGIINRILLEFPLSEIEISVPDWINMLGSEHELVKELYAAVRSSAKNAERIRDIKTVCSELGKPGFVKKAESVNVDLGTGAARIVTELSEQVFYRILSEYAGIEIKDDETLLKQLSELAAMRREYEHVKDALVSVRETGYGIVSPTSDEMVLEEPKIIKQGGRYGVKLKACAPSIHMMRADIETEVSPIVGTVKQSEELIENLLNEYRDDPQRLWQSNIFGKTLNELGNDGLRNKLDRMPE